MLSARGLGRGEKWGVISKKYGVLIWEDEQA